jgi:hypothetical protein
VIVRERTVWLCFVMCVATRASDNGIRDEGARALASALERNSTLQHLNVRGECRGDAGVCAVCGVCGVWMMMRCDCAREDRVVVCRDVCGDACISELHWCRGREGACIGVGEEQHAAASGCPP